MLEQNTKCLGNNEMHCVRVDACRFALYRNVLIKTKKSHVKITYDEH